MLRSKACMVVLLLAVGPLGLYLAAQAQEQAPWPPPPIKPPPEGRIIQASDLLRSKAPGLSRTASKIEPPPITPTVATSLPVVPAASTAPQLPRFTTEEPPLANPDEPGPARAEPPLFPSTSPAFPGTMPLKKAPEPVRMPRADAPTSPADGSAWKPVHPDKIALPSAAPNNEKPPAATVITDPMPVLLPKSAGIEARPDPGKNRTMSPSAPPEIIDTIPPRPLPEPLPSPSDDSPPAPEAVIPKATPAQPPERIEAPSEPPLATPSAPPAPFEEPLLTPPPPTSAPVEPEPIAPLLPKAPTPLAEPSLAFPSNRAAEKLPVPQQAQPREEEPRLLPLPPPPQQSLEVPAPLRLPNRPLVVEPEQQFTPPIIDADLSPPLIRRKDDRKPPSLGNPSALTTPEKRHIEPAPSQIPQLNRAPQANTKIDPWKRTPNPVAAPPALPQPQEEETPAFRLVRPRQYSNETTDITPPLKPAPRVGPTASGSSPSLHVEKRGPSVARLGESLFFEITVRNLGVLAADNLYVVEELPFGMRFVSAEPAPVKHGDQLTWRIPRLHAGQQQRIALTMQAAAAGNFTSKAQVQLHSAEHKIRIDPSDYTVAMTAPRQVEVGQSAKIEIVVNNTGSSARSGLVLKTILPESLAHAMGPYIETDVTLQPGENRKFTLAAKALQPGKVVIEAWLEDGASRFARTQAEIMVGGQVAQNNDEPGSNGPRTQPQPAFPENSVAPQNRGPTEGMSGRLTVRAVGARLVRERDGELRVEIANYTANNVGNLVITATLPASIDFLDASDKGLYHRATKTIYWFVESVAAGQSRSLVVRVKGKIAGKTEFRVQAGTDAGKRAQTQAPVVIDETTSHNTTPETNARLAFEIKNRYKAPTNDEPREFDTANRVLTAVSRNAEWRTRSESDPS